MLETEGENIEIAVDSIWGGIMRFVFICLIFFIQDLAHAQYTPTVPSSSQSTSELIVKFRIFKHFENDFAQLGVDFYSKKETPVSIELSDDESVTFSVNGKQVAYDPKKQDANIIPYIEGAEYSVVYKRANGEIFSSIVSMPTQMKILNPTSGAYFKKTESVTAEWDVFNGKWAGTMIWTPTQMTDGQLCKSNGKVDSDYQNSKLFVPANYTSLCLGKTSFGISLASKKSGSKLGRLTGDFEAVTTANIDMIFID
ncbi:MAG: hypothetical protein AABY64_05085 [Bdellovibrionota bacterium]